MADASTMVDAGMQSFEKGTWQTVCRAVKPSVLRVTPTVSTTAMETPKRIGGLFSRWRCLLESIHVSVADAIFSDKVYEPEDLNTLADSLFNVGVFDTSADGLFKDWSIVYVPYCTIDVHWGNATVEYTEDLVIHHRGYLNTKAALEFAYDKIVDPESYS